jgi:hypothetical protein
MSQRCSSSSSSDVPALLFCRALSKASCKIGITSAPRRAARVAAPMNVAPYRLWAAPCHVRASCEVRAHAVNAALTTLGRGRCHRHHIARDDWHGG